MYDALLQNLPQAQAQSNILDRLSLTAGSYVLATVHRAANTDRTERLRGIVEALNGIVEPVVFPVHPRTRVALERQGLGLDPESWPWSRLATVTCWCWSRRPAPL